MCRGRRPRRSGRGGAVARDVWHAALSAATHAQQCDCESLPRAAEPPGELDTIPDPAPGFEQRWEEDWRHSLFDMAMDRVRRRVSPKQFQIFDLYVNQHLPMDQVTQILNVNAAQVYMAKLRVSSAIRNEMAQLEKKLI